MGSLASALVRDRSPKLMAFLGICIGATLSWAPTTFAQTVEEQVLQAMSDFAEDFNNADMAAVREHLNFPLTTIATPDLAVFPNPEDFSLPFDNLRNNGWNRTSFDKVTLLQVSEDKANVVVDFRRLNSSDEVILSARVFYTFTKQNGRWGWQFRAGGLQTSWADEEQSIIIENEATEAFNNYIAALNNADNEALLELSHLPQVMLGGRNNIIVAEDVNHPLVKNDFEGWRRDEDYAGFVAENIRLLDKIPNRVMFELDLVRINSTGARYRSTPVLWIFTKQNGNWGLKYRSSMPATLAR